MIPKRFSRLALNINLTRGNNTMPIPTSMEIAPLQTSKTYTPYEFDNEWICFVSDDGEMAYMRVSSWTYPTLCKVEATIIDRLAIGGVLIRQAQYLPNLPCWFDAPVPIKETTP